MICFTEGYRDHHRMSGLEPYDSFIEKAELRLDPDGYEGAPLDSELRAAPNRHLLNPKKSW